MKKHYIFTLFATLLFSVVSYGQITELYFSKYAEGSSNNKFVEIYNGTNAAISLDNYAFATVSNAPTTPGEYEYWNNFPSGVSIAAGDVFVIAHPSADATILAQADMTYQFLSNGDDGMALVKGGTFNDGNTDGIVDAGEMTGFDMLDWIGDWQADPGSGWDVAGVANATKDHTLTRKSTVCGPNSSWTAAAGTSAADSEWIVGAADSGWDTLGSFTGCSSNPSITITAPTNGSTIASTNSVDISVSVANFTIGNPGDAGVDGHIHWTVQEDANAAVDQPMKYDTNDETVTVTSGKSYTVTMTLVDNSHTPINPSVSASTTFTVALPCDLVIGSINTTCDAVTSGTDTYTGTIDFTGGNTGVTYTIIAASGTVSGDDPTNMGSGTITVTGLTEGEDVQVTINGDTTSSCNYTRTLYSPACVPFPIEEHFDYVVGSVLTDVSSWNSSNSGDDVMVVAGAFTNPYSSAQFPDPTGNMVNFGGAGKDPYLEFSQQNSGTVYASFIFTPTDMTGIQAAGGYFAVLQEAGGSYKVRLWVRPDAGDNTKFNIGVSAGGSANNYDSLVLVPGEGVFVVLGYDFSSNEIKVWINPDPTNFEAGAAPASTLTEIGGTAANLGRFLLRQDSTSETPPINFDELRISTTWAQVTPKGTTASVKNNEILGFGVYPNPVNNGSFNIKSANSIGKSVKIYNILGKQVFSINVTNNERINISNLKAGIYILKVNENGKTATRKLVIQ